jgi:hypothetical protein
MRYSFMNAVLILIMASVGVVAVPIIKVNIQGLYQQVIN